MNQHVARPPLSLENAIVYDIECLPNCFTFDFEFLHNETRGTFEAKGRRPVNAEWCAQWYAHLWDQYIFENPQLLPLLRAAPGLSDMFGQPGHVCQATELGRIRNV